MSGQSEPPETQNDFFRQVGHYEPKADVNDARYFPSAIADHIAAYLFTMALDEIDFRELLGKIAEKRFQRIAMPIGDGLTFLLAGEPTCRSTRKPI
jgi:hypothetical protein